MMQKLENAEKKVVQKSLECIKLSKENSMLKKIGEQFLYLEEEAVFQINQLEIMKKKNKFNKKELQNTKNELKQLKNETFSKNEICSVLKSAEELIENTHSSLLILLNENKRLKKQLENQEKQKYSPTFTQSSFDSEEILDDLPQIYISSNDTNQSFKKDIKEFELNLFKNNF
eukprot:snap_masked-scaffold_24-processed-gene-4.27-mRNA-1 protein AED:1.00 eAED:1.00 QI:0/-1/0/0/-1/1/1/0/172